jgi:hypothetical protein
MVLNPNPAIFIMLILGVFIFMLIMLLPALLELKKPKDTGPRVIMDNTLLVQPQTKKTTLMVNLEEEQKFDERLVKKIADVISVLPNLES